MTKYYLFFLSVCVCAYVRVCICHFIIYDDDDDDYRFHWKSIMNGKGFHNQWWSDVKTFDPRCGRLILESISIYFHSTVVSGMKEKKLIRFRKQKKKSIWIPKKKYISSSQLPTKKRKILNINKHTHTQWWTMKWFFSIFSLVKKSLC